MTEIRLTIRAAIDWRAAACAGIAAGVVATVAQLVLWWAFLDVLPEILYRDARLTAAMVMGSGVLPPPAAFDWTVMAVATLIHFALSIIYTAVLAGFVSRRGMPSALVVGAVYGLALFGINMYGFTLVFPWFAAARDWITLAAHVLFGVSAVAVYKALSVRR